jgi:hypothetical protein
MPPATRAIVIPTRTRVRDGTARRARYEGRAEATGASGSGLLTALGRYQTTTARQPRPKRRSIRTAEPPLALAREPTGGQIRSITCLTTV